MDRSSSSSGGLNLPTPPPGKSNTACRHRLHYCIRSTSINLPISRGFARATVHSAASRCQAACDRTHTSIVMPTCMPAAPAQHSTPNTTQMIVFTKKNISQAVEFFTQTAACLPTRACHIDLQLIFNVTDISHYTPWSIKRATFIF